MEVEVEDDFAAEEENKLINEVCGRVGNPYVHRITINSAAVGI